MNYQPRKPRDGSSGGRKSRADTKSRVVGTDCLIGWLGGGEGGEIVDEIGYKLKVYTFETNKTNNLRLESP